MQPDLILERIRYIFNQMDDCVCVTTMSGNLIYANPAAEKLFRLQNGERRRIWDSIPFHPANDDLIQLFIDAVLHKQNTRRDLVDYVNHEGKHYKLRVSLTCDTQDLSGGIFLIVINDMTQLIRVHSAFSRYTTPDIAEYVLTDPEGEKRGGQSRDVSILMSDLRGFTALSGRLPSEQLVSMLNHYFGIMSAIIERHRGTVIEFLGDGIFIVFGAPNELPDHPEEAVRCAVEMQNAMETVNAWNRENGNPELEMGIGVNSGTVVVGNIGSEKRMKYGCMGQTVNLTGRLETFSIGGQIYISEITRNRISVPLTIVGERSFLPKGGREEMKIYDIAGIGDTPLNTQAARNISWLTLPADRYLTFFVLNEKNVDKASYTGALFRVSEDGKYGVLVTSTQLTPMQNLMFRIGGHDLYAKVLDHEQDAYRLSFTSRPEGFMDEIRKLASVTSAPASER